MTLEQTLRAIEWFLARRERDSKGESASCISARQAMEAAQEPEPSLGHDGETWTNGIEDG